MINVLASLFFFVLSKAFFLGTLVSLKKKSHYDQTMTKCNFSTSQNRDISKKEGRLSYLCSFKYKLVCHVVERSTAKQPTTVACKKQPNNYTVYGVDFIFK